MELIIYTLLIWWLPISITTGYAFPYSQVTRSSMLSMIDTSRWDQWCNNVIVLSVWACVFAKLQQTHLLLMKHHLVIKRTAQCSHSDERLPHSTDGAGKDIVQLNGLQRVCPLTHGIQWHRVTCGHINHICKNNNKYNFLSFVCLQVAWPLDLYHILKDAESLIKTFKVSQ